MRLAVVVAAAAGMLVVAPATASAAPRDPVMLVHSAKGGELEGGRLALHGVGRRLAWVSGGGDSGFVSVARVHRGLFSRARRRVTGVLHVSGRRRAGELALRLSRPRYNPRRRTVSYRARRLSQGSAASRGAAAARGLAGSFGPATLSIVPAQVGSGGNNCLGAFINRGPEDIRLVSASNWDTDSWYPRAPTVGTVVGPQNGYAHWESEGGFWRGCSATLVWQVAADNPGSPYVATLTITVTWNWGGNDPDATCTSSNPRVTCPLLTGERFSYLWEVKSN